MMDIEARVRSELVTLANSVPPSRDPWSEHLTRRAKRRTRVLTVVAAAAVIAAAVAIPFTVRLGAAPTPPAVHVTSPTPSSGTVAPVTKMPMGNRYRSGPAVLDFANEPPVWVTGTGHKSLWAFTTDSETSNDRQICLGAVTWDSKAESLSKPSCVAEKDGNWGVALRIDQFPDVVVFLGNGIAEVQVRDAQGKHISTSQTGEFTMADVYVADFEGSHFEGGTYTMTDFDGGHHQGHL